MENSSGNESLTNDPASISRIEQTFIDNERAKLQKKYRFLILEPAVFLLFFGWNISGAVFTNQIVFQTCNVSLGFNETLCLQLGTENVTEEILELELKVQPYTTNILMAKSLIESIIPALCSLFIGPWSDKYGRKSVILAVFIGYFLTYFLIATISFLSTKFLIDPWFYMIAFIPAAFSGGNCALITGVFCYITDVVPEKGRAVKMVVVEAAIFIGLLLGTLASSYVFNWTNATTVFGITGISILIGIIYIILYIDESVKPGEMDPATCKLRELFRFELVYDMVQTCFKRRPNFDRIIIWLVMLALSTSIFTMEGSATVFFLFVREKFEWTIKEYSFFDSATIIVMILGNLIGIYILKKLLGLSETVLAIIAFASLAIDSGIKAIAFYPWHLYLATGVSFLKGISGPMCRAILSMTVPGSDIGKVYSLTTSLESISPLISAPLFSMVYKMTLAIYPGAFNLISAACYFFCVVLMTFVAVFQNMHQHSSYTVI